MRRFRRWLMWTAITLIVATTVPVILLRWIPPPTSTVMLERRLSEGTPQAYLWVPLARISPYAALAVVTSEDQKFPTHNGFDFDAIRDAVADKASGGRLRGASTLTQQVARNLFLWQGRSYIRKGLEAWMTLLLELFWTKQRILEVYLNIAEMGQRIFGIEAAAQRFFSVPASALSREQAALLAAVLPNPLRMRADKPSAYVLERRDEIMRQMCQLGDVDYLQGILPSGKAGTGREGQDCSTIP
jgi:monofunctional biosynthetic peptidoglycan transglycosylase